MNPERLKIANKVQVVLAIILIFAGSALIILKPEAGSEPPLLMGLFLLFMARENPEDERVVGIKMSSAFLALIFSYAIKLLVSQLYHYNAIPFDLVDINHFLILTFGLANLIKYLRLYTGLNSASE